MSAIKQPIVAGRRRSAFRLLAAGIAAATLAGCYQPQTRPPYPIDYRLRHPISMRDGAQTVEVFLGGSRGGLNPAQRADVLSFAQQWRKEGTGSIVIAVPRTGASRRAIADSLREIHSIFAASGIPQGAVHTRPYRPSDDALASIKLKYSKLVAEAGPCGLWPEDVGPASITNYLQNWPYWNFGCATQRNLAATVANPTDLVQPRGETPAYTARRSVALDKYRKGDSPSGKYDGYDDGKISNIGQ